MVYLDNVSVDYHFPQIGFHVLGGDELPMLAKNVFPYSLLQRKAPFCQNYAKKNAAISKNYNAS